MSVLFKHAFAVVILLTLPGCIFVAKGQGLEVKANDDEPRATKPSDSKPGAVEEKQAAVEVARSKLAIQDLKLEEKAIGSRQKIAEAERKLAKARADLEDFVNNRKPHQVSDSDLDVREAEDRLREAREELSQLEIMYQESELEEKTSEIVLLRGRRQLERAQARLDLRRARHAHLVQHKLGVDEDDLRFAVALAEGELEMAHRQARIEEQEGLLARRELELAVQKAERELKALLDKKEAARVTVD